MKYILLITLFSFTALAEPTIITVDGLSFKCEGCVQVDDNYCNIPWGNKNLNVLCTSVVNVLLQKVKKGDAFPRTDELINYLSRSDINSVFKKIAYRLVLEREVETRKLEAIISLLTSRDYDIVPYVIDLEFEYFNQLLWERRKLLSKDDYFKLIDLNGGLTALVQDLTVIDLEQDILILQSYAEYSGNLEASSISSFLNRCMKRLDCKVDNTFSLSSYLYRVQNTVISNYVLSKKDKKIEDINLLIDSNYKKYRTPETHSALISLIETLEIKKKWENLDASQKDFLGFMADKDNRIAKLMYQEPKKDFNFANWIFFLTASILISAIFFILYSGKKVKHIKNENRELEKEFNELSQIWSFFDLDQGADIEDLKRSYRYLARQKHPDVSGSAEDFMLVNKYYKRALELLDR